MGGRGSLPRSHQVPLMRGWHPGGRGFRSGSWQLGCESVCSHGASSRPSALGSQPGHSECSRARPLRLPEVAGTQRTRAHDLPSDLSPAAQVKVKPRLTQSCPTLRPRGLFRLLCLWNSPGRNTGVGSLLQGILPNQGSNQAP